MGDEAGDGIVRASLNITPDASGLSYFDEKIFFTIIRNGQYGARKLNPPMPWPHRFVTMAASSCRLRRTSRSGRKSNDACRPPCVSSPSGA